MRKRLQNMITSIIGGILMLTGAGMVIADYFIPNYDFTMIEYAGVLVLGWVFLTARDTLIEGIFVNIFKVKK